MDLQFRFVRRRRKHGLDMSQATANEIKELLEQLSPENAQRARIYIRLILESQADYEQDAEQLPDSQVSNP